MPLSLLIAGLATLMLMLTTATDAQTLQFTPQTVAAASGARAALTADFNRDGWSDVATANVGRNTVVILLNAGPSGGFTTREIPVSTNPFALASGDVNRDGMIDLVVSGTGGTIDVLLLRSDATLRTRRLITGAGQPRGVVLADFTRDGYLDLAYADFDANAVKTRRGDGSGAFPTLLGTFAVGSGPQGLAAGDFDHNGRVDLAVANTASTSLSVLFGTGNAAFTRRSVPAGRVLHELVAADLNGDSWLDIAATSSGQNTAVFFAGSRTGFVNAGTRPTGSWPRGITADDLNQDGRLDVIVADRSSSTITVFLGREGSVLPDSWGELPAGRGARTAVTADFDHDGRIDIAVGAEYATRVTLFANDTAFAPAARTFVRQPGPGTQTEVYNAVADFNENGRPDLVTFDGVYLEGSTFVPIPNPVRRLSIEVGDFNRDGHMDIAYAELGTDHASFADDGLTIFLGDGLGGFRTGPPLLGFAIIHIDVGDVNRDGRLDIVGAGRNGPGAGDAGIVAAFNTGTGWNARLVVAEGGNVTRPELGDINRDGKLDLVTFEIDRVAVRHGDGRGAFGASHESGGMDNTAGLMQVAHLNHDGILDVAVDGFSLQVYLGRPDGTYGEVANYFPDTGGNDPDFHTLDLYIGDFTLDGNVDVIGRGHLFEGRGDGSFVDVRQFTGFDGQGGVVVDWNRDGLVDVVETRGRLINQR